MIKALTRRNKILFVAALFPLLTSLLSGCTTEGYKGDGNFKTIDRKGWAYGDTIVISVPTEPDSMNNNTLGIAVRHDAVYQYSNLWLELDGVADGKSIMKDTVSIELYDKYGRNLGKAPVLVL